MEHFKNVEASVWQMKKCSGFGYSERYGKCEFSFKIVSRTSLLYQNFRMLKLV